MNKKTGKLFVVAAPSGAGKTSLVAALVDKLENIKVSVSYTTRPKRADEKDGVNYHFIDESTYQSMLQDSAFLEHATVFGYHYGTGKEWVRQSLAEGIDVVLEIDWQGARQIRQLFKGSVSIFILPPSLGTLSERLKSRAQDNDKTIRSRMGQAQMELAHHQEFDYLVVNQEFNKALLDLSHIVQAERLRYNAQKAEQAALLANLLEKR